MQLLWAAKRSRGYTLIEVLAVVVLMGLVAAVFVPSLVGASRSTQLKQLQSDLIQLDVQARRLAVQGNLVTIRWEPEISGVRVFQGRERPQEMINLMIPGRFELSPVGFENAVVFNSLGQTQSYGYRIRSESGSNRVDFNGLSGWYEVHHIGE
jgi:prepilin-type N-terminal cleavage/methylation domain-containing protein